MTALAFASTPAGAAGTVPSDAALRALLPAESGVASDALLQGRRAVEIHHNGAVYRLQATKLGKLILTK